MCGIAGFSGEDRGRIERMVRALQHRGPDHQAVELAAGASIGNARLAILDPRPEGNQPMWNDDRSVVITYNGEIYNYREIRDAEKFSCKTNTDTEVLLKLYDRYGTAFLPRLRGMFAFGIYDTRTRTWHIARDSSGILPLVVALTGKDIAFASEMRALMTAGMARKPDLRMDTLSTYLRLQYVPGPETLCDGIEALPPGTCLSWHEGQAERRHFTPDARTETFRTREAFTDAFPSIMDQAVKDHLVSDKPVGVFLSGGMDSSIILHHMSHHARRPIKTFTVRFDVTEREGAARFNLDADLARATARHYETDHTELLLTAAAYRDAYRDTARALDQPNADAVSVAQFLLAREAKRHVDVVLCGAGGDELFGGYPRYRIARSLQVFGFIPPLLRSALGRLVGQPSDVLALSPGPELAERLLARPASEIARYARGTWFDAAATTRLFQERFRERAERDPLRAFMEFDRGLWLVDESLRLADAVCLGNGLECRVPFLDPRVIAASFGTRSTWHVTLRRTKALLKDTYRTLLPGHLFALPKASFYPPLAKWFRRECAPLIEETLEHPRMRELFGMETVRTIVERHRTGEQYALHTLSSLTQLRCWFETVYDA
jgi:asparagine synthase (glutamine-hydrolysing)